MAAEDVLITSSEVISDLAAKVGTLGRWLQAIGLIVVLWILMQIINGVLNRKKSKALKAIKADLERIERKVDKLGKKK